ncbi:hypothetical protein BsWGS_00980 [Bradybaena similaris]
MNSKRHITQLRLTCRHPFVSEQLAFIGWCSAYHAGHLHSPRTFSLQSHLNSPPGIRDFLITISALNGAHEQQVSTLEPQLHMISSSSIVVSDPFFYIAFPMQPVATFHAP